MNYLALSPATILSHGPKGRVHYDFWAIRPGETWRYLDINAASLYNAATRLGFKVKKLSPTSAEVTRPHPLSSI